MEFKFGDAVMSVYDNRVGTVCEVIKTDGMQDFYVVDWADGTKTKVAREEIY